MDQIFNFLCLSGVPVDPRSKNIIFLTDELGEFSQRSTLTKCFIINTLYNYGLEPIGYEMEYKHLYFYRHLHLLTKFEMVLSVFIKSLLHSSNSNMIASNNTSLFKDVVAIMDGPTSTSPRRMERTNIESSAGSITRV